MVRLTVDKISSKIGKRVDIKGVMELNLSGLKITEVGSFAKCLKLESLDLSNNRLQRIRDCDLLFQAPSLKKLDLRGNPVTKTENYRLECLSRRPQLQILDGIVISREDRARAAELFPDAKEELLSVSDTLDDLFDDDEGGGKSADVAVENPLAAKEEVVAGEVLAEPRVEETPATPAAPVDPVDTVDPVDQEVAEPVVAEPVVADESSEEEQGTKKEEPVDAFLGPATPDESEESDGGGDSSAGEEERAEGGKEMYSEEFRETLKTLAERYQGTMAGHCIRLIVGGEQPIHLHLHEKGAIKYEKERCSTCQLTTMKIRHGDLQLYGQNEMDLFTAVFSGEVVMDNINLIDELNSAFKIGQVEKVAGFLFDISETEATLRIGGSDMGEEVAKEGKVAKAEEEVIKKGKVAKAEEGVTKASFVEEGSKAEEEGSKEGKGSKAEDEVAKASFVEEGTKEGNVPKASFADEGSKAAEVTKEGKMPRAAGGPKVAPKPKKKKKLVQASTTTSSNVVPKSEQQRQQPKSLLSPARAATQETQETQPPRTPRKPSQPRPPKATPKKISKKISKKTVVLKKSAGKVAPKSSPKKVVKPKAVVKSKATPKSVSKAKKGPPKAPPSLANKKLSRKKLPAKPIKKAQPKAQAKKPAKPTKPAKPAKPAKLTSQTSSADNSEAKDEISRFMACYNGGIIDTCLECVVDGESTYLVTSKSGDSIERTNAPVESGQTRKMTTSKENLMKLLSGEIDLSLGVLFGDFVVDDLDFASELSKSFIVIAKKG